MPPCESRLRAAGLRPTRQRLGLARLLLDGPHRHLTAEELFAEATEAGVRLSQATVYNTLNQFVAAGLIREVLAEPGRAYFDTDCSPHHHFFHVEDGRLEDVPAGYVTVADLPPAPSGTRIARVDVVIRVEPTCD